MKQSIYDTLAWIARYFLPAAAALWTALSRLWGLPYSAEVAGTLAAVAVFLNAVLGLSSVSYWKEHEITAIPENEDAENADPKN